MDEFHGQASVRVGTTPAEAFGVLTDDARLPEWNAAIEAVVGLPPALAEGAEWTIKMHPPRMPSWLSVSRVTELDRDRFRFAHRSRNADGNPSYVNWAWHVDGAGSGAEVTVTWDCYLKTVGRRFLAGPLRKGQLAREVPRSLAALASAVAPARSAREVDLR
ncbi:MAG: SRPBCC family protein [Actinobacteria bacterium]|nr:SRPBCC family protein [Actinomycetota bacterium]